MYAHFLFKHVKTTHIHTCITTHIFIIIHILTSIPTTLKHKVNVALPAAPYDLRITLAVETEEAEEKPVAEGWEGRREKLRTSFRDPHVRRCLFVRFAGWCWLIHISMRLPGTCTAPHSSYAP